MKFCPYNKGGEAEKVLAMLKRGHTKFWGSFNTGAWGFGHSDGARRKTFSPIKRGRVKSFTLSWGRGGGQKDLGFPASFVRGSPACYELVTNTPTLPHNAYHFIFETQYYQIVMIYCWRFRECSSDLTTMCLYNPFNKSYFRYIECWMC